MVDDRSTSQPPDPTTRRHGPKAAPKSAGWIWAAVAAVIGVSVGFAIGASSTKPTEAPCDCAEIEALQAEVESLRRALGGETGSGSDAGAGPDAEPEAPAIPKIVEFRTPTDAVSVTQRDNGTLLVVNRDPSLTGKQVAVQGITQDGKTMTFEVRVPAPRQP